MRVAQAELACVPLNLLLHHRPFKKMARHLEAVHGRRLSLSWLVSTDRQVGCRTLPAVEDHFDSAAGAEGDAGEHADFLFGGQVHAEALGYSGEQEDGFHHGEAGADANSGAAAEWKV